MEKVRIAIIDDALENRRLIANLIKDKNCEIVAFKSGEDFLSVIQKEDFELILMDVVMPNLNGFETFEEVKKIKNIDTIFITSFNNENSRAKAYEIGGIDYICKPINYKELRTRVSTVVKIKQLNREINKYSERSDDIFDELLEIHSDELLESLSKIEIVNKRLTTEIEEMKNINKSLQTEIKNRIEEGKKIENESRNDILTGILNRKGAHIILNKIYKLYYRNNGVFSLCFIDIDNLKITNDRYGHDIGDQLLISFVECTRRILRESDYIARIGGDEFIFILPDCTEKEAKKLLQRLKNSAKECQYGNGEKCGIEFSVGVVDNKGKVKLDIEEMIKVADDKMYLNKRQRKNNKQ